LVIINSDANPNINIDFKIYTYGNSNPLLFYVHTDQGEATRKNPFKKPIITSNWTDDISII